jgi:hypothetical protein
VTEFSLSLKHGFFLMDDALNTWIYTKAAGLSFLQVGSLGNPERASAMAATVAGASAVALMDPTDPNDHAWTSFRIAMRKSGVDKVECYFNDPLDLAALEKIHRYDIVCCLGQIYHNAEPLALLHSLHKLTKEYIILETTVVDSFDVVVNNGVRVVLDDGDYISGSVCSKDEAAAIDLVLRRREIVLPQFSNPSTVNNAGLKETPGMWKWFFTPGGIESLLDDSGFFVEHRMSGWGGRARTFICRKI